MSIAQNPSIVPDWIPNAFIDYIDNVSDIVVTKDIVFETVPIFTISENSNKSNRNV